MIKDFNTTYVMSNFKASESNTADVVLDSELSASYTRYPGKDAEMQEVLAGITVNTSCRNEETIVIPVNTSCRKEGIIVISE